MVIPGWFFEGLVGMLGAERLLELWLSRRHAQAAFRAGAIESGRGHYPAMVLFHTCFLASCVLELEWFHPSAPALVEDAALAVAVLAQGLRYWAILTLGDRWNTRIIVWPATDGAPVRRGPYRFIRHPNYLAVVVELAAFPMVHGCFRTAIAFTFGNAMMLAIRIPAEERALGPAYRSAFASTRRFVPGKPVGSMAEGAISEADVLAEIRRIARQELGYQGAVETGQRLVNDLHLDSMTLTVLGVALEDRFRVILTDVSPEEIETVGSLAACIARKSAERSVE